MKNIILTFIAGLLPLGLAVVLLTYVARNNDDDAKEKNTPTVESPLNASVIEPPLEIPDFTMESTTGTTYVHQEHNVKFRLMYFGYLACPDFCPTTMAKLKQVYEALNAPKDNIEIIFVSVDPERDTIERLTTYVNAFHPDFVGLRAEPAAMPAILQPFGVTAIKNTVDSALGYVMDHTTAVYLVDENGNVMGRYAYNASREDIIHDLELLIQ